MSDFWSNQFDRPSEPSLITLVSTPYQIIKTFRRESVLAFNKKEVFGYTHYFIVQTVKTSHLTTMQRLQLLYKKTSEMDITLNVISQQKFDISISTTFILKAIKGRRIEKTRLMNQIEDYLRKHLTPLLFYSFICQRKTFSKEALKASSIIVCIHILIVCELLELELLPLYLCLLSSLCEQIKTVVVFISTFVIVDCEILERLEERILSASSYTRLV